MNAVDLFTFTVIGSLMMFVAIFIGSKNVKSRFSQYSRGFARVSVNFNIKDYGFYGGLSIVAIFIATLIFMLASVGLKTYDTEIINGSVTSKDQERVSCSHSYECNCRNVTSCSGSGQHRSCTTTRTCDTCYEHNYDYDWMLRTNIGDITIDRIDRQGTGTPPRWKIAKVADPVAKTHSFKNYVKAVPESLFNSDNAKLIEQFKTMIPAYPGHVYDYHYIDRALTVGVPIKDLKEWSQDISLILRELGPTKQANVIVIFVNSNDSNVANAINASWLGGKKNDITIVIGSTEYPKIDWVGVHAWTDNELFKVQLRDAIFDIGEIKRTEIVKTIFENVKSDFKRKSFKSYAYLENDISMSFDSYAYLLIIQLLLAIGTFFVVRHNGKVS
jgi:hypothetical protein